MPNQPYSMSSKIFCLSIKIDCTSSYNSCFSTASDANQNQNGRKPEKPKTKPEYNCRGFGFSYFVSIFWKSSKWMKVWLMNDGWYSMTLFDNLNEFIKWNDEKIKIF